MKMKNTKPVIDALIEASQDLVDDTMSLLSINKQKILIYKKSKKWLLRDSNPRQTSF